MNQFIVSQWFKYKKELESFYKKKLNKLEVNPEGYLQIYLTQDDYDPDKDENREWPYTVANLCKKVIRHLLDHVVNRAPHFQVTPQISYAYDWLFFHLEFYVGYEIINPIYRVYRDAPTQLSSPWRGFRTEYPEMTLNPFEEWGCGQKLSGMSGFYMGFSIGIPSPMID